MQLPLYAVGLGACAMPLVVLYPLAKRYTDWPQAVLGVTFNWGAMLGWAAVHSDVDWLVVGPLYGGAVCWTLVYDTLYAHQDKKDDRTLGLKSTALTFGPRTKPILAGFAAATTVGIASAGHAADLSWPFFAATALGAGHLAWQVHGARLDDPSDLWMRFQSNNFYGAVVLGGIVAGHF